MAPWNWLTHHVLAVSLVGDRFTHDRARATEQEAVRLAPPEAGAYVLLARTHLDHGSRPTKQVKAAAKELLRRALTIDPNNATAMAMLADAQRLSGDLNTAMATGFDSTRTDPSAEIGRAAISGVVSQWAWRAHLGLGAAWWLIVRPRTTEALREPPRPALAAVREVRPSIGPWMQSARNVVECGGDDEIYTELRSYLKKHRFR